jgi:hypothetical protein
MRHAELVSASISPLPPNHVKASSAAAEKFDTFERPIEINAFRPMDAETRSA